MSSIIKRIQIHHILPIINLVGMGCGLGFSIVFARMLGATEFGSYAQIIAWANLLGIIANFGLPMHLWTVMSRLDDTSDRAVTFQHHSFAQLIPIGAVIVITQIIFITILPETKLSDWQIFIIFLFAAQSFGRLSEASLTAYDQTLRAGIQMNFLPSFVQLNLFGIAYVFSTNPVSTVIFGLCFIYLVYFGLEWWRHKLSLINKNSFFKTFENSTNILRQASAFFILTGVLAINTNIDLIMLGILSGDQNAGFYRVALSFYGIINIIIISIATASAPEIAQAVNRKSYENFQIKLKKLCQFTTVITALILAVLLFLGEPIVSFIYGVHYKAAYWPLIILSVSAFLVSSAGPIARLVLLLDLKRELALSSLLLLVFNIILNFALIPLYGGEGAAIATGVTAVAWNIWLVLMVYTKIRIRCFVL